MIAFLDYGYAIILVFLSISLSITAIGELFYYFTMARFMVGGKVSLYKGVIILDFAFFTLAITDLPNFYLILYLVAIHAFSALVDILRANEARINGAKNWLFKLASGVFEIFIAIACIWNINEREVAVLLFSLGVIYSGLVNVVNSFKRTAIVYIQ
jgi:hypothetical protein